MPIYKITATERVKRTISIHVEANSADEADKRADQVDPAYWGTEDEYSDTWETESIELCEAPRQGVVVIKPLGLKQG